MQKPFFVKLIAVLYYIFAFFNSLAGFLLAMLGVVLILTATAALGTYGPALVIGFGFLAVALGFFQFFVGRGLWRGKQWARIAAVVIAILSVAVGLWRLFLGENVLIWSLVALFSLFIAAYLLFSPGVRMFFSVNY